MFDEYERLDEMEGARELFQEAGDDAEMRERDGTGGGEGDQGTAGGVGGASKQQSICRARKTKQGTSSTCTASTRPLRVG